MGDDLTGACWRSKVGLDDERLKLIEKGLMCMIYLALVLVAFLEPAVGSIGGPEGSEEEERKLFIL